jgi:hypothetical protein
MGKFRVRDMLTIWRNRSKLAVSEFSVKISIKILGG